jgi:hypothetical protein
MAPPRAVSLLWFRFPEITEPRISMWPALMTAAPPEAVLFVTATPSSEIVPSL